MQLQDGIEKTAGVCGGNARIMNTRIPVWVIVQARNLGNTDGQILENYPTLKTIDLSNVWAYAVTYPTEIAQAIQENEDAYDPPTLQPPSNDTSDPLIGLFSGSPNLSTDSEEILHFKGR